MKLLKYIFIFLIINFATLAIGGYLMSNGPQTDWYTNLEKAPWTPPGWVFGAAWFSIMLCFSIYMGFLYKTLGGVTTLIIFGIQVVLNTIWNFIFFNLHLIGLALTVIILLTFTISVFMFFYKKQMKLKTLLILPYFIWLCIATSLNGYILLYN
ncbi:TspO/MBR family protein [Hyunsoonleella sp. 2307UL5-6]|uniref:TspO/MBR family protein n=1 Tax=Hyunsoonleella sp. 2307UL5-6 TaxID=3384768 RepID=UPI0039BC4EE5